jgi:hypothetical protein
MAAREQQKAQGNTKKAGEHEPPRTSHVDLIPILHDDYPSNRNRDKYREGCGHAQRKHKGKERNSD